MTAGAGRVFRGGSVCSGIGGAEVAAPWVDWKFVAENAKFPSAVLAHRFPGVPNRGDLTKWRQWPDDRIELVCGGTPCQSFSVGGLRRGLADPRGNLAIDFLQLAHARRPRWVVWENVAGVLFSSGGRDFAAFVGGLVECGFGVAWRVLNARLVRTDRFPAALPQSRNRVFVVGCADADFRSAAEVLLDEPPRNFGNDSEGRQGHCGNPASPADETGTGFKSRSICLRQRDRDGRVRYSGTPFARCLTANTSRYDPPIETFIGEDDDVRRMTPTEWERLMGFPDGWTAVPKFRRADGSYPEGPRYTALGNSWAVNVAGWVFDRIREVDARRFPDGATAPPDASATAPVATLPEAPAPADFGDGVQAEMFGDPS